MCYFLYGALDGFIDPAEYKCVIEKLNSRYHFAIGGRKKLNACVESRGRSADYRITSDWCDCETPIGAKDPKNEELREFAELLTVFRKIRGAEHVYLSKNWTGDVNKKEETVYIGDIDLPHLLANVEPDCLYKIELNKRNC